MDKEYLIRKWLADELTEAEMEAFKALEDYDSHKKIIEAAKYFKASEVIEMSDLESFEAKAKVVRETKGSSGIGKYQKYLNIAAIFAILLGVGTFLFFPKDQMITTGIGEKITIDLPDESVVVINSGSSIDYKELEWKQNRKIQLEGEAFFKVSKGSRFDVETSSGTITVLGTEFNVKSRDDYFEITCFEGLVHLEHSEGFSKNIPGGSTFKIVKGEVTFKTDKGFTPQWLNDISTFDSVPFIEVLNEFERHYDVTFKTDNIDTNRIFTGGFVHKNLEDGLKSITLPLDLTYSIDTSNNITFKKIQK